MKLVQLLRPQADPAIIRRRRAMKLRGNETVEEGLGPRLLGWYEELCYEAVGKWLDKRRRGKLAERLKQADMHISPGLYLGMQLVTSVAAAVVLMPLAFLHFGLIVGTPWWSVAGSVIALAAAALTFGAFPFTVTTRINKRREAIEKELPFSLSELSVLAAIGLSPIQIMAKMADRDQDPAMTGEFRKVVFKTRIQGKDLITSLAETARESPSPLLRETFWDLSNMMHQGSNVAEYLTARSNEVLELKRSKQEQFIDTLGTFGDMYVTGVLLSVIFLGMGSFLIDAFGTGGAITGGMLLSILAYFLMPTIVVVVAILLSTAHARVD